MNRNSWKSLLWIGLADRYNSRKIFAFSALLGAILNGLLIRDDFANVGILEF